MAIRPSDGRLHEQTFFPTNLSDAVTHLCRFHLPVVWDREAFIYDADYQIILGYWSSPSGVEEWCGTVQGFATMEQVHAPEEVALFEACARGEFEDLFK
jgi:hypothetical protein